MPPPPSLCLVVKPHITIKPSLIKDLAVDSSSLPSAKNLKRKKKKKKNESGEGDGKKEAEAESQPRQNLLEDKRLFSERKWRPFPRVSHP